MIRKTLLVRAREAALGTVEDQPLQGLENVHMMRHTPSIQGSKVKSVNFITLPVSFEVFRVCTRNMAEVTLQVVAISNGCRIQGVQ